MKKIVLLVVVLLIVVAGAFFFFSAKNAPDGSGSAVSIDGNFAAGSLLGFTLPDQFGNKHSLTYDTKKIIITSSQKSSHIMKDFLQEKADGYLNNQNILYLADISAAPGIIRNRLILPRLQEDSAPVLLIFDEEIATKFVPTEDREQIRIVLLENKKITDIKVVATIEELREALREALK